jgi:hypothetical protein
MNDPRAPVYQYDVYISETSLYDVTRNQLVWAGTAQTTNAPHAPSGSARPRG